MNGGYVVASTVWSSKCPDDDQNIRVVKLDSSLNVEWSEEYGECNGSDQLFDFVVDRWKSCSVLVWWKVKVWLFRPYYSFKTELE